MNPRRGYGRACLTGIANVQNADIVVFLDGDYSDRPTELPLLLAPIIAARADITLGSRVVAEQNHAALPWHQRFGNRLAASLIGLLYHVQITDLGPFRAARIEVLNALELKQATYGWAVEMILKGAKAGFRIVEVPVSYYPRIGTSKISGTVRGTIGAGWYILDTDRALLFLAETAGPAAIGMNIRGAMQMQSPLQRNDACTLVIMAKAPRPGMVKTRIAQRIPVDAVTELYRCLLDDTVTLARSLDNVEVAIMCPTSDVEALTQLAHGAVHVVAQKGDGLAAGLTSVFAHFTAGGPATRRCL